MIITNYAQVMLCDVMIVLRYLTNIDLVAFIPTRKHACV